MKYKVGDKVRVKSLDWYNQNISDGNNMIYNDVAFVSRMTGFCGLEVIISRVCEYCYRVLTDEDGWAWTDEMFEDENVNISVDCGDDKSATYKASKPSNVKSGESYNAWTDYKDALRISIELIKSGASPCNVADTAKSIISKLKND